MPQGLPKRVDSGFLCCQRARGREVPNWRTPMPGGFTPTPTPDTQPFWDAAKQERLAIQRCMHCERYYFYPRPYCPSCTSTQVEWRTVSGRGRLLSYVIDCNPFPPADPAVPKIIALVELDEGPRMLTNIVGSPPEPQALLLDAPVTVEFEDRGDHTLPVFRLENDQ
ncbi:Zn-ribbon domain-containing OB-fold protein [Kitasatospora sp. NPDC059327]|uniref:Zn-ribbon domain-containing OB-fold protein n=1 Tax=Kitasatospora sp. NPDC059327 TaxID=3346803 RepID=UPI003676982E